MDASSKSYIETVSKYCYSQLTYYQYNTSVLKISEQYREGRLSALKFVSELSFEYLQKEKALKMEFKEQLARQMKQYSTLQNGEYKKGLYDGLNEMLNVTPPA